MKKLKFRKINGEYGYITNPIIIHYLKGKEK